jgi:hypothetical protein
MSIFRVPKICYWVLAFRIPKRGRSIFIKRMKQTEHEKIKEHDDYNDNGVNTKRVKLLWTSDTYS